MDPGHPLDHPRTVTRFQVVDEARRLLDVPYRHQGRSIHGVDCVGLPIVVLRRLGFLPAELERANYGRLPKAALLETAERFCSRILAPELGALLLIRWPGEKSPGHSAIVTEHGIIHAYEMLGRVVEHGYRGAWVKLTHSVWRLPGVGVTHG